LFADDKQLYTALSPDEIHDGLQCLTSCISYLQKWRLQLNASKSEIDLVRLSDIPPSTVVS